MKITVFRGNLKNFELYLALPQNLLVKRKTSLDHFYSRDTVLPFIFNNYSENDFLKMSVILSKQYFYGVKLKITHLKSAFLEKSQILGDLIKVRDQTQMYKVCLKHVLLRTAVLEILHGEFQKNQKSCKLPTFVVFL